MKNFILKKVVYSLLLISIWVGLLFIFLYPDNNGLGETFKVVIFLIFTLFFSLAVGIIMLILQLLKLLKTNSSSYIFIAVLNISLGLYGAVLLLFHQMTETKFISLHLLSLLMGLIMIMNVFIYNKIKNQNSNSF